MTGLFWLTMLASIILAFYGIGKKKPLYLIIAAVLILPFALYIAATPVFKWWGLLLPICYLVSAWLLHKKEVLLSVLIILPVITMIGWVGLMVVLQP